MAQPLFPNTDHAAQSDQPSIVTVVICTYNRCQYLTETLMAVCALQTPAFGFEVLVIDNASTDATHATVADIQSRVTVRIAYVYEPRLGLSVARNCAIDRVTTPYLAFLDDDSPPDPAWLTCLLEPFTSVAPSPAAVGGRVILRWSDQQPTWLPDELLGIYSYLNYGDTLQAVRMVNGCNVAFPTALLRQYHYDPRVGLVGKHQLPGEDKDILQRMRADQRSVYFQPSAVVTHIIGRYRENPQYVWQRSQGLGREQALLAVMRRWPGRLGILKLMLREGWNQRRWWKRLAVGVLTGKLWRSSQERTWACSVLNRFGGFQQQMASFFFGGAASLSSH